MSEKKHWAQSNADPESGAPEGVRPISLDALNHLGVDPDGNLYWIDTKILTAKTEFRLTLWQSVLATLTAFGAILAGVAASFSAYFDWVAIRPTPAQEEPSVRSAWPATKSQPYNFQADFPQAVTLHRANFDAFEVRYVGKVFSVVAPIHAIQRTSDTGNELTVEIKFQSDKFPMRMTPRLSFPTARPEVWKALRPGQKIEARCELNSNLNFEICGDLKVVAPKA